MSNYIKDLVSIIILSYNNSSYYKECLKSVSKQNYRNIEIIISDDNSKYFNEIKIMEFIKENNNGNIVNTIINKNCDNFGVVKNYNKALKMTNGEYIFYLCMDDELYDENVIQDVVNNFKNTNKLIFTGYRVLYNEDMTKKIKTLPRKNEADFINNLYGYKLYEKLCLGSFIAGCCTPFKKELLNEGYLNEEYFHLEDYPRYLSLLKKNIDIGFIDRILIKYRQGGITTSGKINEKLKRDIQLVELNEKQEFYKNNFNIKWLNKKRIIAWGTGECLQECLESYSLNIDYLLDSNKELNNTYKYGFKIYNPLKLMLEKEKNDRFIFIFSYANYFDIAKELDKFGFVEKQDYYLCNKQILDIFLKGDKKYENSGCDSNI
ncbi:glycosyltransferase [Clostridium saccharoperbutylacetonicum]